MLSKAAFNALLKTLEEPPEHAIFIFATTEPHKVLPTILSRVQRFDFKRISVDEIVKRLKKITTDEGISIDHESLHVIAKKADGALRDALSLLDQAIAFCGDNITYKAVLKTLNVVGSDRLFEFMNCVTRRDTSAGLHLIHTLLQEGYDIQEFLVGLVEHLRNLYVAKQGEQMILIEASADTKANYFEAATTLNATDIMRYLYLISEQQVKIRELSQPRIAFELMFLKMAHIEPLDEKKKLIEGVKNLPSGVERVHTSHSLKNTDNDASRFETRVGTTQEAKQNQEPSEESPAKTQAQATATATAEISTIPSDPATKKNSILDDLDLGAPSLGNPIKTNTESVKSTENEDILKPSQKPSEEQIQAGMQDTTAPKPQKNIDKSLSKVDEHTNTKNDACNRQNQLSFDKIIAEWPSYLNGLEGRIPKILELQVERVKPVELLGDQLILECDNPLSKQMLDQHSRELSVFLKDHIGVMVRLQININNKKKAQTKEKNPYDFFKELVQKDPILKDIVDKLGAELEY